MQIRYKESLLNTMQQKTVQNTEERRKFGEYILHFKQPTRLLLQIKKRKEQW